MKNYPKTNDLLFVWSGFTEPLFRAAVRIGILLVSSFAHLWFDQRDRLVRRERSADLSTQTDDLITKRRLVTNTFRSFDERSNSKHTSLQISLRERPHRFRLKFFCCSSGVRKAQSKISNCKALSLITTKTNVCVPVQRFKERERSHFV